MWFEKKWAFPRCLPPPKQLRAGRRGVGLPPSSAGQPRCRTALMPCVSIRRSKERHSTNRGRVDRQCASAHHSGPPNASAEFRFVNKLRWLQSQHQCCCREIPFGLLFFASLAIFARKSFHQIRKGRDGLRPLLRILGKGVILFYFYLDLPGFRSLGFL